MIFFFENSDPSQQGSEHHPAGNFQYPFSFQLPPTLPSSFEGEHGNVRYFIKGTIDRPWRFDHTCKTMFTVVANFDLNQLPQLIVSMILIYFCIVSWNDHGFFYILIITL